MKQTIRTTIIAVLLLGLTAAPTHADDEALAAFGGFVAGMITGAILESNSDHHHGAGVAISYESHRGHGVHARYDRGPRCGKHHRYDCHSCHRGPKGYWKTHRVKVWVPGHWSYFVNDCGDRTRVWTRGHYTYQTKRVWVARHHKRYERDSRCG